MHCKFAICDDETAQTEYLSRLVSFWAQQQHHTVSVQTFASAEQFLFSYAAEKNFDILLLDIEMNGMDGVTMARRIRMENTSVQIIFLTGYSDYIAQGYEVEALHYLLKPIAKEKLFAVLDRAVDKLRHNEKMLVIETNQELVRVPLHEIIYAEVQKNYVTIHAGKDYTFKCTLSNLEAKLDGSFFRLGRSYIVNLTFVRRVKKNEVWLSTGIVLPLPRGMYEELNRAIIG